MLLVRDGPFDFSLGGGGGGGAQIRKKYRACLELKKKKIEHQHHQKKYRAQKISKLERKILQPDFWL